jgi:hypothetical protein
MDVYWKGPDQADAMATGAAPADGALPPADTTAPAPAALAPAG